MYEQPSNIKVKDHEENLDWSTRRSDSETVYVITTYQELPVTNAKIDDCDKVPIQEVTLDVKTQNAMADFKELLCITPQIKMDSSIEACETMCGVYECWRVLTPTVRAEIFYEHTSELHKKRIEKAVGSAHMELQVAEFKAKAFGKQLEEFKLESRKKIEEKDEEIFKIQTHVEWLEELAYKIDAIEIIESSDDDETLPEAQNKPLLDSESSDESNFNEQDQANASLDNEEEYSQKVLNQEIINVDSSSDEDETVPGPHQNIFLQNFQCQVL